MDATFDEKIKIVCMKLCKNKNPSRRKDFCFGAPHDDDRVRAPNKRSRECDRSSS